MKMLMILVVLVVSACGNSATEEERLMVYYLPPMNTYYGDIDLNTFKGHSEVDSVALNQIDYKIIETKLLESIQNNPVEGDYSFDTRMMIFINVNGSKREIGLDLFNHAIYNGKVFSIDPNVLMILARYIPTLNAFLSK